AASSTSPPPGIERPKYSASCTASRSSARQPSGCSRTQSSWQPPSSASAPARPMRRTARWMRGFIPGSFSLQVRLEQLEDALVLVEPCIGMHETVALERIAREFEVVLAQLDQALEQAHRILVQHVVVDH